MVLGVIILLAGVYSLFSAIPTGARLLGARLQNPADSLLHLAVGIWAILAARGKKEMVSSSPPPSPTR